MLIYSKTRYISTETNMMIIRGKKDEDDGYYYVHRGLYDQAVILNDIYGKNYRELCEVLTGKAESRDDVDYIVAHLPSPINILGCFLLLVEEEIEEFLDMVGAIHVMSSAINFRRHITIPMESRANVDFSLSIREEYELPWDRFFKESIPWRNDLFVARAPVPLNGTATVVPEEPEVSTVGDDGVDYGNPLDALVLGADDDVFDNPDDDDEPVVMDADSQDYLAQLLASAAAELDAEEAANGGKPKPAASTFDVNSLFGKKSEPDEDDFDEPAPAPAPAQTAEPKVIKEEPKVKSGLDFLRGLS